MVGGDEGWRGSVRKDKMGEDVMLSERQMGGHKTVRVRDRWGTWRRWVEDGWRSTVILG